ncbi:hypothetical protein SAMN05421640_2598 [Ekhidna lutea]|uniref:Viral A-type inclusion protein n=1 Tax=Ekhidna lutea TaxID=447679 RepID=A0A239KDJ8_EKHLU|nr:hypothetical protein [Ekhidna lutea]SNT16436.1 hypothetical protein SAMN05421640_2598 [Ekhidna lutea]
MKNLILLATLTLFFSCSPSKKEELQNLKDEVIDIHDEVMPKMGELRRTRKDLLLQADSLMETDTDRAAMLTTVANEIADANESMMQWMRAFEPEFEGTDEEIKKYMEDQKVSIQQVKEDMNSALAKGREVLED